MKNLHVLENEFAHNGRVKTYPDGSQEVMVCSRPIFHEPGWESETKRSTAQRSEAQHSETDRAARRARSVVRDLALSNDFTYFVTLTLNDEIIDRYDMTAIMKKLNIWLDNRVRRNGLKYVLVPEEHKDGAIHFHGFFNDALPAVESGHFDGNGHIVYNLPAWSFGFSTAIKLYGEYNRAVSYVCKYIGKSGKKIGGRWYLSGGVLARPVVDYADFSFAEAYAEADYVINVEAAGAAFAVKKE